MKKRLLSLALAAAMAFSSVAVYADETEAPVEVEATVDEAADEAVVDEVADDADAEAEEVDADAESVETYDATAASDDATYGPSYLAAAATEPWLATVFGNAGGETRLNNIGNAAATGDSAYYTDGDGNSKPIYGVEELNSGSTREVKLNMGGANPSDSSVAYASQGKISSSEDGMVYYYRELDADDDFTISATAHVNNVNTTNNQVSFGINVRNDLQAGTQYSANEDSLTAGPLQMKNKTDGTEDLTVSFYRVGGAVKKITDANATLPAAGQDIPVKIKKSGNIYTLTYGTSTNVVDADEVGLSLTGKIYAGVFTSRCADVTFSNLKISVVGEPVEIGEWETNGNGLNGKTKDNAGDDQLKYTVCTASSDNSTIDLSLSKNSVGKFSNSEDSYSYRAVQAPAGEDFTLTSSMMLTFAPTATSNQKQAATGAIIFDQHYVKDATDGTTTAATTGNSFFVGLYSTDATTTNFGIRTNVGGSVTTQSIFSTVGTVGSTSPVGPFDIMIKKSGDSIKVKVTYLGETKTVDYTTNVDQMFTNNEYIGYAVARDGQVSVTNNSLYVGSKAVKSLSVYKEPDKTSYYTTEPIDMTGIQLLATYKDGSTEVIDSLDDMAFTGYDETNNGDSYFTEKGTREVKVSIGTASVNVPLEIRPMKILGMEVKYQPINTEYYTDAIFSDTGIVVNATMEDGTVKTLGSSQRAYSIDGKSIDNTTYLTDDLVGSKNVKVEFTGDDNVDTNGMYAEFPVVIRKATLTGIRIFNPAVTTTFYIGDELDTAGMAVKAIYTLDDGTSKQVLLKSSEWTVTGFDSTVSGTKTLTVIFNEHPEMTVNYSVQVLEVSERGTEIVTYPRLTYAVGADFDASSLTMNLVYNSGKTESIDRPVYYFFDGTSYKTSTGEETDEATAKAKPGYYIDLTNFDNTTVGKTQVDIVSSGYGDSVMTNTLTVTIEEPKSYGWRAMVFGASSLGVSNKADSLSSYVNVTTADGTTLKNDRDIMENTEAYQMNDGTLPDVSSVDVVSWDGSGKVSGDQDGIAYFYTKVDATQNFKISGDITVNRYVRDPDDPTHAAEIAKKMADEGVSQTEAIDRIRSGQECFGIMARDVIPYAGGLNNQGNDSANTLHVYQGGVNNHMTTDPDKAVVGTDGQPMDIYQAYMTKTKVQEYYIDEDGVKHTDFYYTDSQGNIIPYQKDENGNVVPYEEDADHVKNTLYTYSVAKDDVENTFASNIVIAGGCTDSSFPTDTTTSSYYKKSTMNRINIMIRRGVTATDGGGERVGITSTTDTLPLKGDKYNITLQKLNAGFAITTYNYQTGESKTVYDSNSELLTTDVLATQDKKNLYVGFFASRYADITVENIQLYEIDPDTDKVSIPYSVETYSPKLSIGSPLYTTSTTYALQLKANNENGGIGDISLNGNVVYQGIGIGKSYNVFSLNLEPNSVNEIRVSYTPSTADNCTSYDTVTARYLVTQKQIDDVSVMYVSPDGDSTTGDGTRENPLDLETALGLMKAGSTVIMLEGTYNLRNTEKGKIEIADTASGYAGLRKTLKGEEGAKVVIDLENLYQGIECAGSYWTFENFEITKSGPYLKPFQIGGNHCIVKNVTSHDNQDGGLQISRLVSTQYNISDWPSDNLVIDCESYNNCDPSKQNADGFAAKLTVGYGNVFKDCISHHNLDDGWDCYTKLSTGAIGQVTLEDCITYKQTYKLTDDGKDESYNSATASGNGFKLGGENIYVMHYLKDCKTFLNPANGVDSNNNPAMKMRNVISYKNSGANFSLYSGTGNSLTDSKGSQKNSEGKPYKFDYDLKGLVSAGVIAADKIGSVNDEYGNVNATPILNETNYFSFDKGTPVNSEGTQLDESTFFLSTNSADSLNEYQRYTRNEDGTFDHGIFLARSEAYVHDEGDEVVLPSDDSSATATTVATTEVTTKTSDVVTPGGGGGSVKATTTTDATTEATTAEATTKATAVEDTTEATTSAVSSLITAINPPKASDTVIGFTDLNTVAWAKDAINTLAKAGVLSGTSATTFRPSAYTKRADFVIALVNALGLESDATESFSDVPATAYYAEAVATAKEYGIVNGLGDGTFNPEGTISRQDTMVIIARTYAALGNDLDVTTTKLNKFTDAAEVKAYAVPYVAALINLGAVSGDDNSKINPLNNVSRAEMAILVSAVYSKALEVADAVEAAEAAEAEENAESDDTTVEETTEATTEAATTETTTVAAEE